MSDELAPVGLPAENGGFSERREGVEYVADAVGSVVMGPADGGSVAACYADHVLSRIKEFDVADAVPAEGEPKTEEAIRPAPDVEDLDAIPVSLVQDGTPLSPVGESIPPSAEPAPVIEQQADQITVQQDDGEESSRSVPATDTSARPVTASHPPKPVVDEHSGAKPREQKEPSKENVAVGREVPQEAKERVDKVIAASGIEPNPKRLFVHGPSVAYESADEKMDVVATDLRPNLYGSQQQHADRRYTFRGLFPHHRHIVEVDNEDGGDEKQKVMIETFSTSKGLNDAFATLNPPEGSLRFEEQDGVGFIPPGLWVHKLARRIVPQADIEPATDPPLIKDRQTGEQLPERPWERALHDRVPGTPADHPTEWMITSYAPGIREAIVNQAQLLETQYGDQYDGTWENAPPAVKSFIAVTDHLQYFSDPAIATVMSLELRDPPEVTVVLEKLKAAIRISLDPNEIATYKPFLQSLGLVSENTTPSDKEVQRLAQQACAEYACAAAAFLKSVNKTRPFDESQEQQQMRIAACDKIIATYGKQALTQWATPTRSRLPWRR